MGEDFNIISSNQQDPLHNDKVQQWGGNDRIRYARQVGSSTPYGVTTHAATVSGGALDRPKPLTPTGLQTPDWVRNRQRPAISQ